MRLSPEQLFAVCSPKLLSGKRRLAKPADILKFPLIHMDSRADWKNWLQEAGIDEASVTHGPVLNRASMVIDAAINGQGVALARTTLAAWDLIHGHLVRPFPLSLPLSKTYWIICPKATASLPKIVTFRDWLLAEASLDLRQLKKKGEASKSSSPAR
jgi:LysR family glycine cleavage system transcriptional activator